MKSLLKVMLILGAIFASTFILGRVLGILTVENVQFWLEQAQTVDPLYVIGTVVLLLFIDLFVAVPTLTIMILAGYFLGFPAGAATAFTGSALAAFAGYGLSRKWGDRAIGFLIKDEKQRTELEEAFYRNGPVMITLSRAAPIVTEVTACIAGATRMPFWRYVLFFSISTLPYVLIASYAGSISSLENPKPAIFGMLFLYLSLWIGWFLFRRSQGMIKQV